MNEGISNGTHTEYKNIVGHRGEWIDDWQCDWESWGLDPSGRTSRLSSAQQFKTYEEAKKARIRASDGIYMVRIVRRDSVTIELDGNSPLVEAAEGGV